MKRYFSMAMAVLMLSVSGYMWFNGTLFTDWLSEQRFIVEEDEAPLIGLQAEEHWTVIVVDFPDHPASDAWGPEEAELLLEQAAQPYIEQLSGASTTLTVHVHPTVVRASSNLASYGADGSGKDTNNDGQFLPARLAREAVENLQNTLEWAQGDLNGDGVVDRLLILHSTKGQEESSGVQERIWSHFTTFEDPIEVSGGLTVAHYTMASLQTGSSGVGTILHEMLHQMGAVDLYPVHDEGAFQTWKGPGDWDIMASGNWNGGGRWPALATGATLDLIGGQQIRSLELDWPATAAKPCLGPTVALSGLSEAGEVLKIQIAEYEYVYIEHRSDFGYDERLPGHGVLVTYQDRSVGDLSSNELNTNPNLPWLMVVEADEGRDLFSGANQGEASDLFQNNTSFGAEGVQIRTHDGVLVPWTAHVQIENGSAVVSFEAIECNPSFAVDLPDHGATVLSDASVPIVLNSINRSCMSELTSSDGRAVSVDLDNEGHALIFSSPSTPNSIVRIQGRITCDESSIDLDYNVHVMKRIPKPEPYEGRVDPTKSTDLTLSLASEGNGSQILSVELNGPLDRVASTPATANLEAEMLVLTVEPNGLLVENMLIKGEVILSNAEGLSWVIPVELVAQSEDKSQIFFLEPHQIIALLTLLFALSLLSTGRQSGPNDSGAKPEQKNEHDAEQHDPWGRPLDGPDSTASLDVEVSEFP